jgi:hypothetical protein
MSKYIIHPSGEINAAYAWLHDDEDQAVDAAMKLAGDHNCVVRVARIVGIVNAAPRYELTEEDEK